MRIDLIIDWLTVCIADNDIDWNHRLVYCLYTVYTVNTDLSTPFKIYFCKTIKSDSKSHIADDSAVGYADDPLCFGCNLIVVCDQYDGSALSMKINQDLHDLSS